MDSATTQKRLIEIQNSEQIQELFGKLVSGKLGYKTIIEKPTKIELCSCGKILEGDEKFCPECGQNLQKQ